MTITAKRRLVVLSLALLGIAPFFGAERDASAQSASLEAARREGKVVIYGTIVPQIMSVIQTTWCLWTIRLLNSSRNSRVSFARSFLARKNRA